MITDRIIEIFNIDDRKTENIVVIDGDIICEDSHVEQVPDYYTKEDGVYYHYFYELDENDSYLNGYWDRTEISEAEYLNHREILPLNQLANQVTFEMFEHNIETGAYEVRNVHILGSPDPVDKFSLTFKDGVLIKFEVVMGEEDAVVYIEYNEIHEQIPAI